MDLWPAPVSQPESSIVTYSRAADSAWHFRAITPNGPFEEHDLEFSTPDDLIASDDIEVLRDSGALKDGRLEDEGTRDDLLERSEEIRRLWHDDLSQEP